MRIAIEAGHGGADPGAVGHDLQEKNLNLIVAFHTAAILQQHGLQAILIRGHDHNITLPARTNMAIQLSAQAYLSIHFNAFNLPQPRGMEIFHSRVHPSPLGRLVLEELLIMFPNLPSRGLKTRLNDQGQDWFHTIRAMGQIPSIVTEGAFITNPEDAELLKDPSFLFNHATALARGVIKFANQPMFNWPLTQASKKEVIYKGMLTSISNILKGGEF